MYQHFLQIWNVNLERKFKQRYYIFFSKTRCVTELGFMRFLAQYR